MQPEATLLVTENPFLGHMTWRREKQVEYSQFPGYQNQVCRTKEEAALGIMELEGALQAI